VDVQITTPLTPGPTAVTRIEVDVPFNINAFRARQLVKRFMFMDVSSQIGTDEPALVIGKRLTWAVPVVWTSPNIGIVGQVGEIHVDVATGEVLANAETLERITKNAHDLARRTALQTGME
jgi:hypothetical protein